MGDFMGPFTGPPCTLSNQMFCWGHHVFQGPRHPRNLTTALLYLTAKQGYKMKRFIFLYKKTDNQTKLKPPEIANGQSIYGRIRLWRMHALFQKNSRKYNTMKRLV